MAQHEHVHPGLNRQRRVRGEQRGRLDQAVGAVAVLEAHVVADDDMVDAGLGDRRRHERQPPPVALHVVLAHDEADGDAHCPSPPCSISFWSRDQGFGEPLAQAA
jgi:hypothetical protein